MIVGVDVLPYIIIDMFLAHTYYELKMTFRSMNSTYSYNQKHMKSYIL